jgi:predicted dehydrogenase
MREGRQDVKRFDVAVIGCGNVARMHFDAYANHPDRVRVVAACDPLREHLNASQERYGFEQGFGSLEEMIEAADWEVGVVCTPTPVRRETVGILAGAGRHVFVEKPFADTYEEARRMVERCDEAGVKLAVNQNFRYHYPFEIARRLISEGRVGNVVSIAHQDLMFRQDSGWRIRTERHALSVMGIHWLDGFRWILGDEAASISCKTRSSPAIDCSGETDACVQVVFERGAMASYVQSLSSPISRTETLIIGDEGMLRLDYKGAALFDKDNRKEPKEQWEAPYSGARKPEATFEDLNLLLTSLEQGSEPPNSGHDNLKTVALLDGAYRSAGEGRPILLQEGVAA